MEASKKAIRSGEQISLGKKETTTANGEAMVPHPLGMSRQAGGTRVWRGKDQLPSKARVGGRQIAMDKPTGTPGGAGQDGILGAVNTPVRGLRSLVPRPTRSVGRLPALNP